MIQPTKFVEYTAAGAIAGAVITGVGATILHTASADVFDRRRSTLAGFVGGAATHAVYGLLSAWDGEPAMGHRLQAIGRSLPMAALTSGIVGGALLGLSGYHGQPPPDALVLSGIIGGCAIGAASLLAYTAAILTCNRRPSWTQWTHGDLGQGERLMGSSDQEFHDVH